MTCWHIYSKIKITFYIARDGYFLTPLARTLCTASSICIHSWYSTQYFNGNRLLCSTLYCRPTDQTPKKEFSVCDRFTTPRDVRVGAGV